MHFSYRIKSMNEKYKKLLYLFCFNSMEVKQTDLIMSIKNKYNGKQSF
jgi:hypothetical protein